MITGASRPDRRASGRCSKAPETLPSPHKPPGRSSTASPNRTWSFRIVPAQGRELHLHFLHVSLEAHPQQPGLAFREKTLLTKTFRPRARPAAKADRPLTACHHLLDLRSRKTQAGQGFDRLRADGTKRDLQARPPFP